MITWLTLLLIVLRLAGFMTAAPFFSRREIPVMAKIVLVWAIALMVLPGAEEGNFSPEHFLTTAVLESVNGLALGWGANVLFLSFQGAGHIMEQQAGFGMASWFDPSMGQTSVLSKLMALLGVMMFLALDGHHILIMAATSSFAMVPPGIGFAGADVTETLLYAFAAGFIYVLRFAAPVMVVIFITDILLGLLGKTVPQLNVLMMGLPVKGMVSMLILISMMPAYINLTEPLVGEMMTVLSRLLESGS